MPNDRIEKRIELKAPVSRVWRAITDYREFGEWFKVKITHPGYEHVQMRMTVVAIEPERLFSFTWHPYGLDPKVDYSKETPTLVEFRLTKSGDGALGTLLEITESGFDKVPSERRDEAFRMNDSGWAQQVKNIESYVAARP